MSLENDENESFISLAPYDSDLYEVFNLANGQVDEYPKNNTKDRSLAKIVAGHFLFFGKRDDLINWVI